MSAATLPFLFRFFGRFAECQNSHYPRRQVPDAGLGRSSPVSGSSVRSLEIRRFGSVKVARIGLAESATAGLRDLGHIINSRQCLGSTYQRKTRWERHMRKFVLIAGIVLMCGTAHAAEPWRNLSLASTKGSDKPVEATRPDPAAGKQVKQADAPPASPSPQADAKPPEDKPGPTRHVAARPRHRQQSSIQARVIYELHRAGYYW